MSSPAPEVPPRKVKVLLRVQVSEDPPVQTKAWKIARVKSPRAGVLETKLGPGKLSASREPRPVRIQKVRWMMIHARLGLCMSGDRLLGERRKQQIAGSPQLTTITKPNISIVKQGSCSASFAPVYDLCCHKLS